MCPACGKNGITILPAKGGLKMFRRPDGRGFFEFPHQIGRRNRGSQAEQQMNVVLHAADGFRHPAQPAHRAAEIFVEPRPPFGADERPPFLGAENNVMVQAVKGGAMGVLVNVLAPLRGAFR
jgi:hypothetical protein